VKTFAMCILGCKVNDFEATYVRNELSKEFKEVSFKDKADIYLIFTCCVTNTAEAKTRKFLHQARRNNPDSFICAIGCLAQVRGNEEEFKDIDLIVGSTNKDEIVNRIKEGYRGSLVRDLNNAGFEHLFFKKYPNKSRSFLKIQDGCNQFCSYCIIPYSRGRERCGQHELLIKQAKELCEYNRELVLTGIHTGRYHDGSYNLYNLLSDLLKIDKLSTLRLSSIELNEISDDIIDLMANNEKLAHHLHIPLQAGSDEILKLMNRPYDTAYFLNRINYIRQRIPDISISTDLIAGFPNESDELFQNTLDFLKEVNFSFIHVFPYARKKGTVADKMNGHLDEHLKKERVKKVLELSNDLSKKYYSSFIGKNVEVLIEKNDDKYSYGYARQYFYVQIPGKFEIGSLLTSFIEKVEDDRIIGQYVTE